MKGLKIFFFCLLFFSLNAFSQNYNGYRNFGGVDRSIGRDYSTPKKPSDEEIEKGRNEQIDKYMLKLREELTLDELQFIAIKNEVVSSGKLIDIILKREDNKQAQADEVKEIVTKSDKVILSYLNPKQKEKYIVMKEELASSTKIKKNKKKDKKEEEQN